MAQVVTVGSGYKIRHAPESGAMQHTQRPGAGPVPPAPARGGCWGQATPAGGGTGHRAAPAGCGFPTGRGRPHLACVWVLPWKLSLDCASRHLGAFFIHQNQKTKKLFCLKYSGPHCPQLRTPTTCAKCRLTGKGLARQAPSWTWRGQGSQWLTDRGTGGAPGDQRLFKTARQKQSLTEAGAKEGWGLPGRPRPGYAAAASGRGGPRSGFREQRGDRIGWRFSVVFEITQ